MRGSLKLPDYAHPRRPGNAGQLEGLALDRVGVVMRVKAASAPASWIRLAAMVVARSFRIDTVWFAPASETALHDAI